MKTSISNIQTIILASVLSAALLFGVVLNLYGYHTQIVDAKKSHHSASSSKDATPDNTPATTNSAILTQQQPPIPGAIQLSAKEASGVTSGDIASGSSGLLSFKPGATGVFQYHCLYHPTTMKGIIQVG